MTGGPAVRFRLHPAIAAIPEAVHAIETVASLFELPWSLHAPQDAPGPRVYVGPQADAPPDASVRIPVEDWPVWPPRDVRAADDPDGIRLVLGAGAARPTDPATFASDWLRGLSHLLTREEEVAETRRDQWGCFAAPFSRTHQLQVLDVPIVNQQARRLELAVLAAAQADGVELDRIPRWRDAAPFAAVLSHDVDWIARHSAAQSLRLLARSRRPGDYASRAGVAGIVDGLIRGSRDSDPYWNFERWVDEESQRGFRSTYYVCPPPTRAHLYDPTYRPGDLLRFRDASITVAQLFQTLAGEGFEVGLHGTYLSVGDGPELERQRRAIEAMTGTRAPGIRQHFLRFDVRDDSWQAQEQAGLGYDTTLGYNEDIGFRAGIAAPFRPWSHATRAAHRILEVPLTAMDGALFRTLELDGDRAARRIRGHLDAVAACGGLAVLLWHPNAADATAYPGWWKAYLSALDDLATRSAWVTTGQKIADWWETRTRRQRRDDPP
jgi:hypothetical protein